MLSTLSVGIEKIPIDPTRNCVSQPLRLTRTVNIKQLLVGNVKESAYSLKDAEMKARSLESLYVSNRQDGTYWELQMLYKEIALLRATACRKLLQSQSQRIFD